MRRSDIYCLTSGKTPPSGRQWSMFRELGLPTRQDRRRERNRVSGMRRQLDVPYARKYKEKSKCRLAVREVRRQEPTNSHQWKGVHPRGKRISGKTLWRKVRGTNRVRALPELSPVHPEPYGKDLVLTCSPKGRSATVATRVEAQGLYSRDITAGRSASEGSLDARSRRVLNIPAFRRRRL